MSYKSISMLHTEYVIGGLSKKMLKKTEPYIESDFLFSYKHRAHLPLVGWY